MKITIIRHGKVDMKWKQWCTSEQFDKDCSNYDSSPICLIDEKIENNIGDDISIVMFRYWHYSINKSKDCEKRVGIKMIKTEFGIIEEIQKDKDYSFEGPESIWYILVWNVIFGG